MEHLLRVIQTLRNKMKAALKPEPAGTLNPANERFNNKESLLARGGSNELAKQIHLAGELSEKFEPEELAAYLENHRRKLNQGHHHVQFHVRGNTAYFTIGGLEFHHEIEKAINEKWYR